MRFDQSRGIGAAASTRILKATPSHDGLAHSLIISLMMMSCGVFGLLIAWLRIMVMIVSTSHLNFEIRLAFML